MPDQPQIPERQIPNLFEEAKRDMDMGGLQNGQMNNGDVGLNLNQNIQNGNLMAGYWC